MRSHELNPRDSYADQNVNKEKLRVAYPVGASRTFLLMWLVDYNFESQLQMSPLLLQYAAGLQPLSLFLSCSYMSLWIPLNLESRGCFFFVVHLLGRITILQLSWESCGSRDDIYWRDWTWWRTSICNRSSHHTCTLIILSVWAFACSFPTALLTTNERGILLGISSLISSFHPVVLPDPGLT